MKDVSWNRLAWKGFDLREFYTFANKGCLCSLSNRKGTNTVYVSQCAIFLNRRFLSRLTLKSKGGHWY